MRASDDADSAAVNASSASQTMASGSNTHGTLNQHPDQSFVSQAQTSGLSTKLAGPEGKLPFRVGVAEDRNKRWRRTMEDSHAFVYDYGGVRGQGFFGVFDGHAGKHAAEWCGKNFHNSLLDQIVADSKDSVPDIFNKTYHAVDDELSKLAEQQGSSSGCTAVTVLLRLEDQKGRPLAYPESGGIDRQTKTFVKSGGAASDSTSDISSTSTSPSSTSPSGSGGIFESIARKMRRGSNSQREEDEGDTRETAKQATKEAAAEHKQSVEDGNGHRKGVRAADRATNKAAADEKASAAAVSNDGLVEVSGENVRRVLYTANVGDARAVLCRGGKAVRLTYDHKGSDAQEAKRIMDAGGFVMNNRVNGVLAVTRSLGDSAMKEFVVGSPYTTETTLSDQDTFLIVACDGLWDVTDDQDAVDLVANEPDPQAAAACLLQHALSNFSTDNTSVMVVRFACEPNSQTASFQSEGVASTASNNTTASAV